MPPVKYYDMIRDKNHKFSLRLAMTLHARTHGIRAAVGKQTTHAGQRTLTLTTESGRIRKALRDVTGFFRRLRRAAEQLDWAGRWRPILSRAFVAFLRRKALGAPERAAIGVA